MWLQVMERPLIFLHFFIHYWRLFLSELFYLRQTFTDYMSNQYTHFDKSTCQMWLMASDFFLIIYDYVFYFKIVYNTSHLQMYLFTISFSFLYTLWNMRFPCFWWQVGNSNDFINVKENKLYQIIFTINLINNFALVY